MKIEIKQHDITDCGAACLASVASYHKLYLTVGKIRQLAGTDRQGTNAWGLIKAAEKIGLTAKGVKAQPEALTQIPLPAIAHVITSKKLQHFVVIYKVTRNYLQIMDPACGKLKKVSRESFTNEWTGVLILLSPSANFKTGNEKVPNIRRFLFLLYPHRKIIGQALAGACLFTLLGLSTSVYIQKITDHVLLNENINLLNLMSIIMLVILVFQIFTGTLQTKFILKTGQLIDAKLILGYYKHLLKLPQRFFDTMQTGEIISRINDAVKIRAFINDTLITLVVNMFIVTFAFTLMFVYNRKLALIMLILIPLHLITYLVTNYLNKKRERIIMEQAADVESGLVESIDSVKTVKQLGLEQISNLKIEIQFVKLLHSIYKSGLNSLFARNSTFFTNRLFTIILLWSGSRLVLQREITPGELMSFYALIEYFTGPVEGLINMNKTYQNASIAADRLFEITDIEPEPDGNISDILKIRPGNIRFRNVTFSYGMRTSVFENFNLTFEKGKITAVVGESGSGKTTIAALLQKLYTPDEGAIFLSDANLTYINNETLRRHIGVVPQNPDLFTGSVLENIAADNVNSDMPKVLDICKNLGMISFIEELPHGYNTLLGEHGATISGGQKQRIALARTLYRSPQILILDEAASSLDSLAESYVQKTIRQLQQAGKTVILITHSLASSAGADKILVLDKGKVVDEGTHEELYKRKGKYYELWQKQMPLKT